jgi:hypothetical protein
MAVELPRCATCRVAVKPGQNVVFRSDGRVEHVDCPEVSCLVCSQPVKPGEPIRREGDQLIHANCWMKRVRTAPHEMSGSRRIGGGASG